MAVASDTYTLEDYLVDTSYFQKRLHQANLATELPASARFDLARSPLSDAQLEEVSTSFGAPKNQGGFGFAAVLHDMLSQDPRKVPVKDLGTLQSNLIRQGYLPSNHPIDGAWDAASNAAFRRWDRDNYTTAIEGNHYLSAPIRTAVGIIGDTLPSSVLGGIVGAAKGLVTQAPTTLERGGLVGGGVEGAIIGGTLGSVIPGAGTAAGAVIGGAIGGAIGFIGSLLHGQTPVQALSPVDEYQRQGVQAFFNDVQWVSTAALAISSVGLAAKGVGAGLELARGASAGLDVAGGAAVGAEAVGEEVPAQITMSSLMQTTNAEPGWITRWVTGRNALGYADTALRTGVKRFVAGGAIGAGIDVLRPGGPSSLGQVGESFLAGGLTSLAIGSRMGQMYDAAKIWGLSAQMSRPIVEIARGAYTGASAFNVGARVVGKLPGKSSIDAAIEAGPQLPDYTNLASFFLYPSQLFPFKFGDAGAVIESHLGDRSLLAGIHAVMQSEHVPFADAKGKLLSYLGPDDATRAMAWNHVLVQHGLDREAYQMAIEQGITKGPELGLQILKNRSTLIAKIKDESGKLADSLWLSDSPVSLDVARQMSTSNSPTMNKVLSWNVKDPTGLLQQKGNPLLEDYLLRLNDSGQGIDKMRNFFSASQLSYDTTLAYRHGEIIPTWDEAGQRVAIPGTIVEQSSERTMLNTQIAQVEKQINTLRTRVGRVPQLDPFEAVRIRQETDALEGKLSDLKALRRETIRTHARTPENTIIAPATLDTPTRGDLQNWAKEELRLREAKQNAFISDPSGGSYGMAAQRYEDFVNELTIKGILPPSLRDRALALEPGNRVADFLKNKAKFTAREVYLDEASMKRYAELGYKPVISREDLLFPQQMPQLMETLGLGDYSRRRGFWETLGIGTSKETNAALARARAAHQRSELQLVLKAEDIKTTPEDVQKRLWGMLNLQKSKARITNDTLRGARGLLPGEMARAEEKAAGTAVVRNGMVFGRGGIETPAYDIRDLSPNDIDTALQDVPGMTPEASIKVFRALKRGAAYGFEMSPIHHPLETARAIGEGLRVNGLLGFNDLVRTWHFRSPGELRVKGEHGYAFGPGGLTSAAAGALAGGALGALHGDSPSDIVRGALEGAFVTAGIRYLANRNYGYLPDELIRMNYALRFSLSPLFDLRRLVKQNVLDGSAGEAVFLQPEKWARAHTWHALDGGSEITGDAAWTDITKHWNELSGNQNADILDEIERIGMAEGITGYNPMKRQMVQAYAMRQRGLSTGAIKTKLADLYQYGFGRTALEKTANFLFFPFSFEKKLLTHVGDFILQAPGRNLLLWEGMKRYHEAHFDTKVRDFLERHAPFLQELQDLNAFAYGISPGQFILSGLGDRRTTEGKFAQLAANVIVPGAVAGELARTAGVATDLAISGFTPLVLSGDSISRVGNVQNATDLMARYVPFVKDLNNFWNAAHDQWIASTQGESKWSQVQDYEDALRSAKSKYEGLAAVYGYTTVDGFLGSPEGQSFANEYLGAKAAAAAKYPTGFTMAQGYQNTTEINRQAIAELAQQSKRTPAQDAILNLAQEEQRSKQAFAAVGFPTELANSMIAARMRDFGTAWASDRDFVDMWNRIFQYNYGPISSYQ